ncbi:hypothetical protein M407DRAFT_35066 [Tulasnella calospora MUT 4182]|uniref:Uncharacterized protein n=1 Tax=Tulasnella calospora MUT 4182 TaxID=1051891 RepID=A0A0C3L0Y6_9AGAM|nr:hypothetical protein M407DRAFT_35066 [Tulasnella calospora MUT 4182]
MPSRQFAFAAPQLKELKLIGVAVDFSSPLFHNLHLLSLDLKEHEPQAIKHIIHQILRQSPHLKRLFVQKPRFRPLLENPRPVNEETLSHTSLVDLHLDFEGAVLDAIVFSTRFPSLRSFHSGYKNRLTLNNWHLPVLAGNSPFPSLQTIALSGNPHDRQPDRHLANALRTLASLKRLELQLFDMTHVADALLALGDSCPQLEALTFLQCTGIDLNQVRSTVDMRLRVDGMTELLELDIYGGIITTNYPELKATKAWLKEHVKDVTLWVDHGAGVPSPM